MKLKYRKIIAKYKPIHLMARWIMYNNGIFVYRKIYKQYNLGEKLTKLKGCGSGKRCFIIGNGPSLKTSDLDKLVNEDCFAANEIYKIFDSTKWRPKFFLIKDRYSKTSGEKVDQLEVGTVFLSDYYLRYHDVKRTDIICLHERYALNEMKIPFSDNIERCFYSAATVTYGLMQIAMYLGYMEVYLIGFDHDYSFEFDKVGNVVRTGTENTHFFDDEIPEDIIANVFGMTKAYEAFKRYADEHGIIVRNATHGGRLEVFERVNLDSILSN